MGAASSQSVGGVDIDNPFPLDEGHNSNLDVLSMIAARILNTGDIYKLDNLTNPGECGNYAVFLRDKIEQTLLPFVTEVDMTGKHGSKTQKEILYQSSTVSIPEPGARKDICTELATTMITVVSIVVASLASIQVKTTSRESQFANNQKGGAYNAIFQWLQQFQFASGTLAVNTPFELITPGDTSPKTTRDRIFLSLNSVNSLASTYGTVYARERVGDVAFPSGTVFFIEIFDPIELPTATQGMSVMPFRVMDSSKDTWLAGVLFQNFFITFVKRTQVENHIVEVIANLFRRVRDGMAAQKMPYDESKAELQGANLIIDNYIRSGHNPGVILSAINSFFTSKGHPFLSSSAGGLIRGQGGMIGLAGQGLQGQGWQGLQGLQGQGQGLQGLQGLQGFGQPQGLRGLQGLQGFGQPQGFGQMARAGWAGIQGLPGPGARIGGIPGATYVIPYVATQRLTTWLSSFRSLLPKESSPAAVRAAILAREVTPDRNVAPGICTDDYFKEPTLAKILPWLTLQLLYIDDITKLTAAPTPAVFSPDWSPFLNNLAAVYTTGGVTPIIQGAAGAIFLESLSFKGDVKPGGGDPCKTRKSKLVVGYKEIKDGLLAIHGAYLRHCNSIFQLISKLIVTIQDGNNQFIRLNPNVVKTDSKVYVNGIRLEARKLISDFYIEIEKLYVHTIRNMQVKTP